MQVNEDMFINEMFTMLAGGLILHFNKEYVIKCFYFLL